MPEELVEYEPGTPFPGTIGKTIDDSKEAWPVPKRAPKGTPNVLFYVLDDTGFGQLSPYGGLIEVPNLERVAKRGVIYTNVHTTGLCSPTRPSSPLDPIAVTTWWLMLRLRRRTIHPPVRCAGLVSSRRVLHLKARWICLPKSWAWILSNSAARMPWVPAIPCRRRDR